MSESTEKMSAKRKDELHRELNQLYWEQYIELTYSRDKRALLEHIEEHRRLSEAP